MDIALPEAFTKVLDQVLESIYGLETYVAPTVVLGTTLTLNLFVSRYHMQLCSHIVCLDVSLVCLCLPNKQSRPFSVPMFSHFRR
jgi:hypothetical protein